MGFPCQANLFATMGNQNPRWVEGRWGCGLRLVAKAEAANHHWLTPRRPALPDAGPLWEASSRLRLLPIVPNFTPWLTDRLLACACSR